MMNIYFAVQIALAATLFFVLGINGITIFTFDYWLCLALLIAFQSCGYLAVEKFWGIKR